MFKLVIDEISSSFSIRKDILEKDYYVTLLLEELSKKEKQAYAYFKGGTALYKALKSIRRFSEDIDLTVYVEDCPTASQAKKRLENAVLNFKCLEKGEILENHRGSITCEYLYQSMYGLDDLDTLQRFGRVKVEATNFTISEPTSKLMIAPHLYELASISQQKVLKEMYRVEPFEIETINLERIFIDKVFAAQFYFERKKYFDVAKHIYDISILLENEKIQMFLKNKEYIIEIVKLKRKEKINRKGGVLNNMKISDFPYLKELSNNTLFENELEEMQHIYVFNEKDKISKEIVYEKLQELLKIFSN